MVQAATKLGTVGTCQLRHPALRPLEKRPPAGEAGHAELFGYSTPRNLNDRTYTVVWLALSLDPIDRKTQIKVA